MPAGPDLDLNGQDQEPEGNVPTSPCFRATQWLGKDPLGIEASPCQCANESQRTNRSQRANESQCLNESVQRKVIIQMKVTIKMKKK